MFNDKKIYYVYRISNIVTNYHYVGYSSVIGDPLDHIGIKYYSSSSNKYFKIDQKLNSNDYKYKIILTFNSRSRALEFEIKYHNRLNVKKHQLFLNKANQLSTGFSSIGVKGKKHKLSTIEKIKQNSNEGKRCFNNGIINIYLNDDDIIPDGFKLGGVNIPQNIDRFKGSKYYTNITTGETKRSKIPLTLEDDWIEGRNNFNNKGFEYVNSGDFYTDCLDVSTLKRTGLIQKDVYQSNPNYLRCPANLNKKKLYIFNNILFYKLNDYKEYLIKNNFVVINEDKLLNNIITEFKGWSISKNKNCSNFEILKNNIGKKYSDFGYYIFNLLNIKDYLDIIKFIYKEEKIWKKTF